MTKKATTPAPIEPVAGPVQRPVRPTPQRWTGIVQAHCSGGFVAVGDYMLAMDEVEQLRATIQGLREMAEDSADRGDVFAQRVLRALGA